MTSAPQAPSTAPHRTIGFFLGQLAQVCLGPAMLGLLVGGVELAVLPSGHGAWILGLQLAAIGRLTGTSKWTPRRVHNVTPNTKLAVLAIVTALAIAAAALGVEPNAMIPGAVLFAVSKAAVSRTANVIGVFVALAALVGSSWLADPRYLVTSGTTLTAGHIVRDLVRFLLVLVFLFGMRLESKVREEAEARAARAADEERARIARDLHDMVAHHVSGMTLQAEAARTAPSDEALARIAEAGRAAMGELRRMLGILRASGADDGGIAPQPGLAQVADLVQELRAQGMPITLRMEGDGASVPAGVALSAYRVVQEALTNVRKHAGRSSSVHVDVRCQADAIEIQVVDDGGPAFARSAALGTGHGLVGMQERVALVGGTLTAGRRDGGGWMVQAVLPVAGT